jgi:alpha-glucosidase
MKEWWRGAVIYQIYPRSYCDANGDGIGDLSGILQRLDHVAAVGADAIWISPFFKSPMKDFGYDVSDYRDVDPVFGTLDDFKSVLNRAHELGLKVLIDQVWSHTSDQHDWFKESRQNRDNAKHDWYVWRDCKPDGTAPNNWLSYFGGPAWTWDARRQQYYLHHFLKEQPTLNLWSPAVRNAIKNTAAFWLDMGVDGFRLDACHTYLHDRTLCDNPPSNPAEPAPTDVPSSNPMQRQQRKYSMNVAENLDWIEELRAFVNQWPERCLLGEAGGDNSEREAAIYTQTGRRFHQAYSFGLVGSHMSKEDVAGAVARAEGFIGDGWICWATSNHDFKRVASRIHGEAPLADKALFATALGLSLRGSYCMYQGEELGLPQAELAFEDLVDPYDRSLYPEHVGRDGCRTPMPWVAGAPHAGFTTGEKTWLPISPLHPPLAVDSQTADTGSVLNAVQALLAWRRGSDVLKFGAIEVLDAPDHCLVFQRFLADGKVTCLFNCSPAAVCIPLSLVHAGGNLAAHVSRNISSSGGIIELKPFGFAFFV